MKKYLDKVFCADALALLRRLPSESIDAVVSDPMYGVSNSCVYDWGKDPARGDGDKHWEYHKPVYEECLRVLKPQGVLVWAQGFKHVDRFEEWFGGHRIWSPLCKGCGLTHIANIWMVQTKERTPVEHPNNMIVHIDRKIFVPLKKLHPCPKPIEEVLFMVQALTKPGDIVLDMFCGLGSTLVAAKKLGRSYIGGDISPAYGRIAISRLKANY